MGSGQWRSDASDPRAGGVVAKFGRVGKGLVDFRNQARDMHDGLAGDLDGLNGRARS